MSKYSRLGKGLILITSFLLVAIAGLLLLYPPLSPETRPLRIAINPWPGYECLHLAEEMGYYKEEGLEISLVEITSLSDVRRAFENGRVDMMSSTTTETVIAGAYSGKELKIVLMPDFSDGSDMILARKGISSVAELKGKRIAIEPHSVCGYLLERALQLNGMKMSNITAIPVEAAAMLHKMRKGKVDAVASYPPFSQEIANQIDVEKIFDSSIIPGEIADVITIHASTLESREEDIQKLVRAWDKAVLFLREHPDEAIARMAKRQGMKEEELRAALQGIRILNSYEQRNFFHNGTLIRVLEYTQKRLTADEQISGLQAPASFPHLEALECY